MNVVFGFCYVVLYRKINDLNNSHLRDDQRGPMLQKLLLNKDHIWFESLLFPIATCKDLALSVCL